MHAFAIFTLLALSISAPLAAAEMGENHESTMPGMAVNSMCPMCMKPVGDHPMMTKVTVGEGAEAKSFMIACDTKDCHEAFMKNPETFFKKTFGKDAPGPKTLNK